MPLLWPGYPPQSRPGPPRGSGPWRRLFLASEREGRAHMSLAAQCSFRPWSTSHQPSRYWGRRKWVWVSRRRGWGPGTQLDMAHETFGFTPGWAEPSPTAAPPVYTCSLPDDVGGRGWQCQTCHSRLEPRPRETMGSQQSLGENRNGGRGRQGEQGRMWKRENCSETPQDWAGRAGRLRLAGPRKDSGGNKGEDRTRAQSWTACGRLQETDHRAPSWGTNEEQRETPSRNQS